MLLLLGVVAVMLLIPIIYLLKAYQSDLEACPESGDIFMGHLSLLMNRQNVMHDMFFEFAQKKNGTYRLHLPFWAVSPGAQMWHTSDPKNVEYILKTNFENFEKGPIFLSNMRDLLGDGIFNADGKLWSTQRKTASHEFSVSRFRTYMTEVFIKHALELCSHLDGRIAAHNAKDVDLQRLFSKYTLQSIGEIGFGCDLGCFKDGEVCDVPFEKAFDAATHFSGDRWLRPWWPLQKRLNLGPEAELRAAVKVIDSFSYDVIRQRRSLSTEVLSTRCDLLSRFMQLQEEESSDETTKDRHLRDIVINFILAGRDTTSNALSWLFFSLGKNPEVEATLRARIKESIGEEQPTFESVHVSKLPYLHAVITETLRLYPSVPSDPKFTVKDATLPSGHFLKAGSQVAYNAYSMGRRESIWGPDAAEFKPERFITFNTEGEPQFVKPSPFEFAAFQAGRRTCLGIDMAYLEMKIVVAMLLQKYSQSLSPGINSEYVRTLTLPMKELRVSFQQ